MARPATGRTAEYIAFEGMLLACVATGSVYFVHADHLGTPQMLTDDTGAVVWDADYRPFGAATVSRGAARRRGRRIEYPSPRSRRHPSTGPG